MFDRERLTLEQHQALALDRHVFVEASAGSGKTAVLVARYLHILDTCPDCDPTHILAVTYTRKAAAEMTHRVRQALGAVTDPSLAQRIRIQQCLQQLPFATIATIHSFCKEMVSEYGHAQGLASHVEVPSDEDRLWAWQRTVDRVLYQMLANKSEHLQQALRYDSMSELRAHLLALYKQDELARRFVGTRTVSAGTPSARILQQLFQEIRQAFQHEKYALGWLDFPDMISELASLVRKEPAVAAQIRGRYRFVMVDEFQDTDRVQWQLLQDLFLPECNLFVVGDLKQSIYKFRGAEPKLFATVREWMMANGGITVSLTHNFRSQETVIHFCNRLFATLFDGASLVNYADAQGVKNSPGRAVYIGVSVDMKEADQEGPMAGETDLIVSWILAMREKHGADWQSFAIVCRKTAGLQRIGAALSAAGIPVQQQASATVYVSVYHQALYLVVRLLVYPYDVVAWVGLAQSPWIGMSDAGIVRLALVQTCASLFAENNEDSLKRYGLSEPDYQALIQMRQVFRDIFWLRQQYPLGKSLVWLCQHYGWTAPKDLWDAATASDFDRFATQLGAWDDMPHLDDTDRLDRLADWLKTGSVPVKEGVSDGVQMMTIHKSKGLEFPFVVIPECGRPFHPSRSRSLLIGEQGIVRREPGQEDTFKDQMAKEESDGVDEEKRVFYVACTRAQEELLLTATLKENDLSVPEAAVPETFWSFLAPYAHLSQDEVVLALPPMTQSPVVCRRWTGRGSQEKSGSTAASFYPAQEGTNVLPSTATQRLLQKTSLQDLLPAVPQGDSLLGTFVHRVVARMFTTQDFRLDHWVDFVVGQHLGGGSIPLLPALRSEVCRHVATVLSHPLAVQIKQSKHCQCEWSFAWASNAMGVQRGRVDLFFESSDGGWVVVDFKTTSQIAVTEAMVTPLMIYRRAVAAHVGVADEMVTIGVFFTEGGTWVVVP